MTQKNFTIITAFILVLLLFGVVFLNYTFSYTAAIKANWNIGFSPLSGIKEVYKTDSRESIHGDGIRYHVFSYRVLSNDLSFENNDDSIINYSEDILDEIGISKEYRPSYDDCDVFTKSQDDGSVLYIYRNKSEKMLYVIEKFI